MTRNQASILAGVGVIAFDGLGLAVIRLGIGLTREGHRALGDFVRLGDGAGVVAGAGDDNGDGTRAGEVGGLVVTALVGHGVIRALRKGRLAVLDLDVGPLVSVAVIDRVAGLVGGHVVSQALGIDSQAARDADVVVAGGVGSPVGLSDVPGVVGDLGVRRGGSSGAGHLGARERQSFAGEKTGGLRSRQLELLRLAVISHRRGIAHRDGKRAHLQRVLGSNRVGSIVVRIVGVVRANLDVNLRDRAVRRADHVGDARGIGSPSRTAVGAVLNGGASGDVDVNNALVALGIVRARIPSSVKGQAALLVDGQGARNSDGVVIGRVGARLGNAPLVTVKVIIALGVDTSIGARDRAIPKLERLASHNASNGYALDLLAILCIDVLGLLLAGVLGREAARDRNSGLRDGEFLLSRELGIVRGSSPGGNNLIVARVDGSSAKRLPIVAVLLVIGIGGLLVASVVRRRQRVLGVKQAVVRPAINRDGRLVLRRILLRDLKGAKLVIAADVVGALGVLAPSDLADHGVRGRGGHIRANGSGRRGGGLAFDKPLDRSGANKLCAVVLLRGSVGLNVVRLGCNLDGRLGRKGGSHAANGDVLLDLDRVLARVGISRRGRAPGVATVGGVFNGALGNEALRLLDVLIL